MVWILCRKVISSRADKIIAAIIFMRNVVRVENGEDNEQYQVSASLNGSQ